MTEEMAFNLIDEPWIKVRTASLEVRTVSLAEALLRSQDYVDLAGELPTQDVAVLRLLLAVLHTVFSRVDEQGREKPVNNANQALLRWKMLWEGKRFPEQPIRRYLEQWYERFWLFHPERPFYQVKHAEIGTEYSAAKLNGELSESANKIRLFPSRGKEEKDRLSYAEAARWLLYVNGFDDTSAKPKTKGLPSVGAGWLGKLGLIMAVGNTLFETLILNLVLLQEKNTAWGENKPIWESEMPRESERVEIAEPDNQAELLTLQSRRILLKRENGFVTGYTLLGGDFFQPMDAFSEQMTLWRPVYQKNTVEGFRPRRHDSSKLIWREFSTIVETSHDKHRPGIVSWISLLKTARLIDAQRMIHFRIASVQYGDKDFFAADVFGDQITFHADILTEMGVIWQTMIEQEVLRCERLAEAVGKLAGDLEKASGHTERDGKGAVVSSRSMGAAEKARERFYHRIDVPFRAWLERIDPSQEASERIALQTEWIKTVKGIARSLGAELAGNAGEAALIGRSIKEGKNDTARHYSTPEAMEWFGIKLDKACKEE